MRRERLDVAEQLALIARARRELLLQRHRHRLRREDLEECFSQALVELVAGARGGAMYASSFHLANVLEQRFLSRVHDRRRALSGRSPMQAALEHALLLDDVALELPDARVGIEELVILRLHLRRIREASAELTPDQCLVLRCQVDLQLEGAEFCRHFGWSGEKYRKVAQRGRQRLQALLDQESGCPVRRVPVG